MRHLAANFKPAILFLAERFRNSQRFAAFARDDTGLEI